ncbi:MAG: serine/threonine-protein kinase [Planctomycetota bacterium]|jgi:serine/threonine protein kinase
MADEPLDELLDRLVGEYSDRLAQGRGPDREAFLRRVGPEHRKALERSLRMLEMGMARAPQASRPLAPGDVLDGYRLVRELGRGGMATVWLAQQEDLSRPVALKLLRPALAIEQRHIDRFRREALAVARLDHPHIVRIHAVGEARGYHWLAMEYVEGKTLAQVLRDLPGDASERPWTPRTLAHASGIDALATRGETYEQVIGALLSEVADALDATHAIGIVHRDVKPPNSLIRKDGSAVVADFGLAKGETDPGLSLTGDQIGTPWYMSPEQALTIEAKVDHRTDVYSLGVTLYESLSGRRPFDGKTALAVLEAIKNAVPEALRTISPECTPQSEAVCRRAMARLPEERYGSMEELGDDLARLARGEPTQARLDEGGPLRRALGAVRSSGVHYGIAHPAEYRSRGTFLGLPLYHVFVGQRRLGQGVRVAKGWLAVGDVALGGVCLGGLALGLLSWGGISVGLLLAFGGMAAGGFAFGGMAVGGWSIGGMALAYAAFGGLARGYYAVGGSAKGVYAAGGDAEGRPIDFGPGGTFEGTFLGACIDFAVGAWEWLFGSGQGES